MDCDYGATITNPSKGVNTSFPDLIAAPEKLAVNRKRSKHVRRRIEN